MRLISITSGLTLEHSVLFYDVRCNWKSELDFDISKGLPKIKGVYKEHIGLIHNRMHTNNNHMLPAKLSMAKQGITIIGLYSGVQDREYEMRENARC